MWYTPLFVLVDPLPKFKYSFADHDPLTQVRASGREVDASPKAAREVCKTIKGMTIAQAKNFLEDVIAKKQVVPFRRHTKEVPHKRSQFKFHVGGYPVKAAREALKVIENLEANAEFKGFDTEKMIIVHAATMKGMKIKRYTPRAYGRSSPKFNTLIHIEIMGKEVL
ncbi:MAG: 50S ribosomal protein L22 [archaeon]|nr:50S ribosomal protein L22 [archaeon]